MAMNQEERHRIGRIGERVISLLFNLKTTDHKAPFDVVDFNLGFAYEVKAMSGLGLDLKIHISNSSMKRKKKFAKQYGLKAILVAVVIMDPETVKIYKSSLKKSIRINQMKEMNQ